MTSNLSIDTSLTPEQQKLIDVWEEHTRCEFEQKSVDHTMATMIDKDAYVNNVPTMMGGIGTEHVRSFYSTYFIYQLPEDTETILLSRTVGHTQIVDELIFKFTHTIEMNWMLPGIAPTGKRVEVALVAIIHFQDSKSIFIGIKLLCLFKLACLIKANYPLLALKHLKRLLIQIRIHLIC